MLKKLSFLLAAVVIMATGCVDEDSAPIIIFDDLERGAFPRLQQLDFAEFDLADLNNSVYQHTVDFVDGDGSSTIASYRILASFDDNNPDNGDNSTETFSEFRTIPASDFRDSDTGNKEFTLTISFTEVAAFFGVGGEGDVISGDRFQFRSELVRNDGVVFNSVNSTPAVTNAFGGIWNWNVNATCPLTDDFFTGDYALSYGFVYDEFELFAGTPVQALGDLSGVVLDFGTVAGSTTRRTFSLGGRIWAPSFDFDPGVTTLEFACDVVTSTGLIGAASCDGTGQLGALQNGPTAFSLEDDSMLEIVYTDFALGGCSGATMDYSLVFTKQ